MLNPSPTKNEAAAVSYSEELIAVFESMSDGMCIHDSEGRVIQYNRRALEILEVTGEQLLGQTTQGQRLKTVREDFSDFPDHERPSILAKKTGLPQRGQIMGMRHKNDTFKWMSVSATPIFKEGEKIAHRVLVTFTDITESKNKDLEIRKALERISVSEKSFRAIFDHSPIGIMKADADHRFLSVNPAFSKLMEYSEAELKNMTAYDLTHPEDLQQTKENIGEMKTSGQTMKRFEKRYITKSGKVIWGRVTSQPIKIDSSDKLRFFAVLEDITAEKAAEKIIEDQQVKLIASAKLSCLGEMAAGVAHEINNPLTIICGKAANLKLKVEAGQIDPKTFIAHLSAIEKTAHRIGKIINGLKAFGRNAQNDPMISVPVRQIMDDTLALCAERFKEHAITLEVKCETEIRIKCRATQIVQVLTNLLSNAFDASEKLDTKWVQLRITTDNDKVFFSIKDSGPGISPEIRDKIMQPFFSTKEVGRGTGLGLSISLGIAQEHQGLLRYDPTSSSTCFILELPIKQAST